MGNSEESLTADQKRRVDELRKDARTTLDKLNGEAAYIQRVADPTRRQILQELKAGEQTAGAIAACFDMAAPSVSRHLAILRNAELISERKEANRIYYRLEADRLAYCLNDFLSQVCPTQIRQRKKRSSKKGPAP